MKGARRVFKRIKIPVLTPPANVAGGVKVYKRGYIQLFFNKFKESFGVGKFAVFPYFKV